jgi:putative transposase
MPNHVHLILVPASTDWLSRAGGEAHRRFTGFINAGPVTGHLFQGRFDCVVMDEAHLINAVRYLAFNPVRARLAASPADWPWSSVACRAVEQPVDATLLSTPPTITTTAQVDAVFAAETA